MSRIKGLRDLGARRLRDLACSLRSGQLAVVSSPTAYARVLGCHGEEVEDAIASIRHAGFSAAQTAFLLDAVADEQELHAELATSFNWVISGSEIPGHPVLDTAATLHSIISEATKSIFLATYTVYSGQTIFEPISKRLALVPGLKITLLLDVPRKANDFRSAAEIEREFAEHFVEYHWPWKPLPEIWFDPRSLAQEEKPGSCFHAKFAIADDRVALVTSANLSEAALNRNVEVGLLVRVGRLVRQLCSIVEAMQTSGKLRRLQLIDLS